jgi:hypothetical protein
MGPWAGSMEYSIWILETAVMISGELSIILVGLALGDGVNGKRVILGFYIEAIGIYR